MIFKAQEIWCQFGTIKTGFDILRLERKSSCIEMLKDFFPPQKSGLFVDRRLKNMGRGVKLV